MKSTVFFVTAAFSAINMHAQRNPHRPLEVTAPAIKASYLHDRTQMGVLSDHWVRAVPILRLYDEQDFNAHLLPSGPIEVADQEPVDGSTLSTLIEHLLEQINQEAEEYPDFDVLKSGNFVRKQRCGLLILKFKKHPFVVKLFIETPEGLTNPYKKGFEMSSAFVSGGGMRHMFGFTRIKTLEQAKKMLAQNPRWKDRVLFPRKWTWLPKEPIYLRISTRNLGAYAKHHFNIPAVYAIIADQIVPDKNITLDYQELMALSRDLEHRIDPHTKNFMPDARTGKIALIDTELFPFIMGFNERIEPTDDYVTWYLAMANKFLAEKFATPKAERIRRRQFDLSNYYLDCNDDSMVRASAANPSSRLSNTSTRSSACTTVA